MLVIEQLNKSFGSRKIINNFSYIIPENEIIALTGVNGAGKTTLLNMICGKESIDSGRITAKKDKTYGYLPQEPNSNPESTVLRECYAGNAQMFGLNNKLTELEIKLGTDYSEEVLEEFEEAERIYRDNGGYSFENDVAKILLGLGFKKEQLEQHPETLSGGQRMRLEIGRLLVRQLDLLILDEPTNHLDLPSIEWLEEYLKKFKGTVLFVSHDEALLNRLPTKILNLSGGFIKEYTGNYEDFLEQKLQFDTNKEKSIKTMEKKIKQLNKFVDRFKAKASLAKQAQNKMKMVEKLHQQIEDMGPNVMQPELNIKIPLEEPSGKMVLNFEGAIGYKDNNPPKTLLEKLSLSITRGQKIGIVGANGLGKSTLLKTITKEIEPINGELQFGSNVKVGYYAQDETKYLDEQQSVIENMKLANPSVPENKLLRILGSFLFKKDDLHKPIRILSGGEKSRLSLAAMLVRNLNFLILDEPTNHLDIMSIQILGAALSNFEGTVIFVSHNRTFIETVATHLLMFENGNAHMEACLDLPEIE